ncbi:MAG: putative sugar nucleotidyl transferase, partial [Bacteroidales bacterium]
ALENTTSSLTEDYLSIKYPLVQKKQNVLINAAVLPDANLVAAIKKLKSNQALSSEDSIIAYRIGGDDLDKIAEESPENMTEIEYKEPIDKIENVCDLYLMNESILMRDFDCLTQDRKSAKISKTNQVIAAENIFIEEGAIVEYATLNASKGPIYIGKNAEVMEGACLRGGVAICEGATVKMNAKIYGATTIGPYSKVGGELSNVVIFGYSNKSHDGFLGNAVLGEWCNLGADTNNSNLKNDYSEVKIWSYAAESFVPTGQTFCGLFMGDHSKTAINTMLNTGTVVGVCANIFGAGFPRQFIPSYTWGGKNYQIDTAIETAVRVYARRQKEFTEVDETILRTVYANTHENREKGKF